MAFLDIDGLKRVNDDEGHDAGDALLADVARTLQEVLSRTDVLARTGGDEFCVLVAETVEDPRLLRSRLVESFRRFNEAADRPYRLAASIGLVHVAADNAKSLQELVAEADGLMYVDKEGQATAVAIGLTEAARSAAAAARSTTPRPPRRRR
ncbi:MAG: GGDEF domain-containing protein [Actinomycetota bacterium]|nr:GGDEF domain-containing protein [Actinomycetota bacterium]